MHGKVWKRLLMEEAKKERKKKCGAKNPTFRAIGFFLREKRDWRLDSANSAVRCGELKPTATTFILMVVA